MKKINKIFIIVFFLILVIGKTSPVRGTNQSIFTVSVWVKPASSAASKAILGKAEELRIATNGSGQPVCQIKSSSSWQTAATSSAAISVGAWSHVACTYDLAYVRIYVNGVEKGSQALAVAADDTSAVWKIGRDDSASTPYGYFGGQIDEYKFYSSALTPEQIKTDLNQGKALQLGGQNANNNGTAVTGQAAEYCVPGDTAQCDAPKGEWKFDEGSGGDLNDTSGNGGKGTWYGTGGHYTVDGKANNAGDFNGSSDYVSIPDSTSLDLGSTFTVSMWVNWEGGTISTFPRLITKKAMYNAADGWEISLENGYDTDLTVRGSSAAGYPPNGADDVVTSWAAGGWHHIEVVYQGTSALVYSDGIYRDTVTIASVVDNNQPIRIGRYGASAGNFWNGRIDQVRIYGYARTPAQIAWDYNRGKPIGWWKMDEGEGDKAYDSSGNGNTGTLTTMDPPNDWVTGKFGKALDFDGSNDYVDMGHKTMYDFTGTQPFSLSAWVKTTGCPNHCSIISNANQDVQAFPFIFKLTNSTIQFQRPNTQALGSNSSLSNGLWYHIAAIYNGTNQYIYLNGKLDAGPHASGNVVAVGTNTLIGAQFLNSSLSRFFPGQIDDVRVYNYALTAEQVKQVMNEGSVVRFGD